MPRRLDGQAVAAAFGTWLTAQALTGLADAAALLIALDGKTVRGARASDDKAPHLQAATVTGAWAVIAQKDVDAKTNEITQVRLLDDLNIPLPGPCPCRHQPTSAYRRPAESLLTQDFADTLDYQLSGPRSGPGR